MSEKKAGAIEMIKEACNELKDFMDAVVQAHKAYISSINTELAMKEMEWITDIQDKFRELNLQYVQSMLADVEVKPK